MKIRSNFLVISNHNNDTSWVPQYSDNYLIYDRSDNLEIPSNINPQKVIRVPNVGYNLYDYFTFIIDHYENLPEVTIFAKGNVFPRHISREFFESIMNNGSFTPIEKHDFKKTRIAFIGPDGGFNEKNNSWYIKYFKTKYFRNYSDFLRFFYKSPLVPKYVRFAPGANYIVPKQNILNIPKITYENLRLFVSHDQLPGEAHILERALYTIWTNNEELNPEILRKLDPSFVLPSKYIKRTPGEWIWEIVGKVLKYRA